MNRILFLTLLSCATLVTAKPGPYDSYPEVAPPYYRVQYPASSEAGELPFVANYTIWIPPGVETLRGVIVHQHGCGEGSCKSGLTAAFDLHWQALARKHDCALLGPSYAQPQSADCQLWCDPRNGSDRAFQQALHDLGKQSGHPELPLVPWALWGHSGGGHWAGGMVLLHPDRVAAAWLRSGVPFLEPNPDRTTIKPHDLKAAVTRVPIMCNPGTKEGVTVKEGRFSKVWPANLAFFEPIRAQGGLIGIAVDPLSSHECGNQRYLAIPWLDTCLSARLSNDGSSKLRDIPANRAWLAPVLGSVASPANAFEGDTSSAIWLPGKVIAKKWEHYVTDTAVPDTTPPPAPTNIRANGNTLSWNASADLESGLAYFIIERDGEKIGQVPKAPKNNFGRPLFQGLQYSDTPVQPLVEMRFTDKDAPTGGKSSYRVIAVNTMGLASEER